MKNKELRRSTEKGRHGEQRGSSEETTRERETGEKASHAPGGARLTQTRYQSLEPLTWREEQKEHTSETCKEKEKRITQWSINIVHLFG
ncbi:hypothetical protein NDU88_006467 [Pleurodeles waltl]|uniref:Uncharacterized protein n=1 Tax=Pleurodeles waltl TaxID=8319 RepID=A0AAV7X1M4_PLEWA|nr:hypothetical protein NDU88_006467 [Pleurodeles waltl]